MKRKYLVVIILLLFLSINTVKAITIGDCKVLVSFKLSSSLDEEKYICKGIEYGKNTDAIYYSAQEDIIYLNDFNAYYFTNWDQYDATLNIKGNNFISLLQLGDSNFKVTGNGTLKFKQNSYVKKLANGEPIYQYIYKDKAILNSDKKIYEGTALEFAEDYELLRSINDLPLKYNFEDYEHTGAIDYSKITPVIVTENWLSKHIETSMKKTVEDGYGIIKYVEEPKEQKKETEESTQLETDNVILISNEKLQKKYQLKETNLKDKDIASKLSNEIEQDLISLYDVSVYNGNQEVSMKNGKYIIKIKLDNPKEDYENYQIIYVNEKSEIAEYINGTIEGDYIVFETSHLSQYGVIATPKSNNLSVEINGKNTAFKINIANILKISLLLALIIVALTLIVIILLKSNLLNTKTKKRKKSPKKESLN